MFKVPIILKYFGMGSSISSPDGSVRYNGASCAPYSIEVNKLFILQFKDPIIPTADDTVFNMALRVPWVDRKQGVSFHLSRMEYINGNVGPHPEDKDRTLVFFMNGAAGEELLGHLFEYMEFLKESGRKMVIRVIMQIKCDFISDVKDRAVAGHHLLGKGQSGLNIEKEFNLQGGLYETWIDLTA